jgi:hypothetical protein
VTVKTGLKGMKNTMIAARMSTSISGAARAGPAVLGMVTNPLRSYRSLVIINRSQKIGAFCTVNRKVTVRNP